MKNKIKLSIIVPVYNVEKYLHRCMESLVNQTLQDIEIICINDGSKDGCLDILKEYKAKYEDKIVILDKQNEGVWKGRFDGIRLANGEFITFTDSDDYVALDYAEKLYNAAKTSNADVSICGFYRVDTDTQHIFSKEMTKHAGKIIDMDVNPEDILSINGALWNKIYKAEILKNMDNLPNPPRILDDMMFLLLVFLRVKRMIFISDPLYYYMVRQNSIMMTIKKEQITSTQNAMLDVKKIYNSSKKGKRLLPVLDAMAFLHFALSLMFRVSYDKNSNFSEELKSNEKYLDLNFPTWRKSKYLKVSYMLRHKCANIKVGIMKNVYSLGLYKFFLKLYSFMIDKLKVDIKW
ncbi:MAG: glycosyl transferase family 2 protein [Clostridia bacterium]|jgi:glycosyltransferase involved in cell wall biosynthesis|nr:glycosyl transferase family 2 protein [Clostridia bacterium]